ncbi:hypothetical protein F2P79_018022 [Pimephales promelas]|nr:hypothetical protein F2P79_019415 [Pimephales promelas]KAG1937815.1 hypothetical protein F2P79_018022 [Pimephales promelas]
MRGETGALGIGLTQYLHPGKTGSFRSMLASTAAKQMINVSVRPSGVDIGCVNAEIHPSAPDLDELDEFL